MTGYVTEWEVVLVAGGLDGLLVNLLVEWLVNWLVDWLVDLGDWLAWVTGRLTGLMVYWAAG